MNIEIEFSRQLYKIGASLVKNHFPRIKTMHDAWTYDLGHGHWEFHGPDKFYWHGSADNAWDCRYKGWMAWLKFKGIEV